MLDKIITKSLQGEVISAAEIALLFEAPLFSEESAKIISASRQKSEKACNGLAEVHAQVGLNIAPCPRNCTFCAFAAVNKVFDRASELSVEEAVTAARQFEEDGANAIYVMATADYPFPRYIEMSGEIRRNLKTETVLVANIGDFDIKEARQLKDVGYSGIYHAVRLGEGFVTSIPVEQRLRTLKNAQEAGLTVGTCVEPVGTEHSIEELVEKTLITRDASPCFSGAAPAAYRYREPSWLPMAWSVRHEWPIFWPLSVWRSATIHPATAPMSRMSSAPPRVRICCGPNRDRTPGILRKRPKKSGG